MERVRDQVMERLPLGALVALGQTDHSWHASVAGLTEPARLASARLTFPPSHPACLSSDVRETLQHQRLLASSLTSGTAALCVQPPVALCSAFGSALSSDLGTAAAASGTQLVVTDMATGQARLEHCFPTGCHVQSGPFFSSDDSTLALVLSCTSATSASCQLALVPLQPLLLQQQLRPTLIALCTASHQQLRKLQGASPLGSFSWAPSASICCVAYQAMSAAGTWAAWLALHDAAGAEVFACQTEGAATLLSWSPNSRYIVWRGDSMHCLDVAARCCHSSAGASGHFHAWLQLPASSLQQLLVGGSCPGAVHLLSVPHLSVTHSQHLGVHIASFVGKGQHLLAFDIHSDCLQLFRVDGRSAHGRPFLHLVHALSVAVSLKSYAMSPDMHFVATVEHSSGMLVVRSLSTLAPVSTFRLPACAQGVSRLCWTSAGFALTYGIQNAVVRKACFAAG